MESPQHRAVWDGSRGSKLLAVQVPAATEAQFSVQYARAGDADPVIATNVSAETGAFITGVGEGDFPVCIAWFVSETLGHLLFPSWRRAPAI